MEESSTPAYREGDLAWFAAVRTGREAHAPRRLACGDALRAGETFLRFFVEVDACSDWYGGGAYVDTCNPDATRLFIQVTHERYFEEVGGEFGMTIPGIFTDEPQRTNWTPSLQREFSKRFGYDLLDHLPDLFFHIDGHLDSVVRLHHAEFMTDRFVQSFMRPIGEWCERHGLLLAGHVMNEDALTPQAGAVGSCMRAYEPMQVPGIDVLTERFVFIDTVKQCTSVARQLGRPLRVSELYGCTGWDFPLFAHKAVGDWQIVHGINLRCHHLSLYAMEGQAKRDYPASISYQSPWFRSYRVVEDYFARVNAALSEGEELRDLLVVHPVESTWIHRALPGMPFSEQDEENDRLVRVRNILLGANLDFDYGDEALLVRHARVEAGPALRVGRATYRCVLLPRLRTIRGTTLALLRDFVAAGGRVVYVEEIPSRVDGCESSEAAEAYRAFTPAAESESADVLSPWVRELSIRAGGHEVGTLLHTLRRGEAFDTLFVCNLGMEIPLRQFSAPPVSERGLAVPGAEVVWRLPPGRALVEVDAITGERRAVVATYRDGAMHFRTSFAPLESRLFIAGESGDMTAVQASTERDCAWMPVPFGEDRVAWPYEIDEPNVLVLDRPAASVDGGPYAQPAYVLAVDDGLHDRLGAPRRSGEMRQPWLQSRTPPARTLDVRLRYAFRCEALPSRTVFLGLERPDLYEIALNGETVPSVDDGYWCDRSLRRIPLRAHLLREGENVLELRCAAYSERLPGLESIFLLGEFGVVGDAIVALPAALAFGDWCEQGFPHYGGSITYRIPFLAPASSTSGGGRLAMRGWRGATLGVRINGGGLHPLPWPPYELDIGSELRSCGNEIAITVTGHRRNSHGPFYTKDATLYAYGPDAFREESRATKRLVPCGILEAPVVSKRG